MEEGVWARGLKGKVKRIGAEARGYALVKEE
jgi:hypothetical protein